MVIEPKILRSMEMLSRDDVGRKMNLRQLKVFFLTKEYFNAMSRKMSIAEMVDYKNARQHSSITSIISEMSIASKLAEELEVTYECFSDSGYLSDPEFTASICPFICQGDYLDTAMQYLRPAESSELELAVSVFSVLDKKEPIVKPYRVITYESAVYITVEEGFLSHLDDPIKKHEFYLDVLKAMYALDRINNVNQSAWYRQYLEVLCTTASL